MVSSTLSFTQIVSGTSLFYVLYFLTFLLSNFFSPNVTKWKIFSFPHESMKRVPSKYDMKVIWVKISTGQVIKVWSVWKKIGLAIFQFQKVRWTKIRDFNAEKTSTKDVHGQWFCAVVRYLANFCLFWNTLEFL